jgi:hypothetical protein
VPFSRLRYGQFWIVVRGQDVGRGCGSWQQDWLDVAPSGHAMAGQDVVMIPRTTAITNDTADLIIIDIDVANRILVVNILRAPTDQRTKTLFTLPARA